MPKRTYSTYYPRHYHHSRAYGVIHPAVYEPEHLAPHKMLIERSAGDDDARAEFLDSVRAKRLARESEVA